MGKVFDYAEVAKHNTQESCWVILYGKVYDVTDFLAEHPGGAKVILRLAGQDATEEYDPIHPPGILEETLKSEAQLGTVDAATLPRAEKKKDPTAADASSTSSSSGEEGQQDPVDLDSLLNLDEIEAAATQRLSRKAWAYYYSAADDLHTKRLNNEVYRSILLRPRVFIDVTKCSTATTILGHPVKLPIFVAPAAMARLAHPAGERGIAQACARLGALQIISHNASQTPEQIVADAPPDQIFGWQLYVQTDRAKSEAMLARINRLPAIRFICLTLDAPVPGKREDDERSKNVGAQLPVPSAVASTSTSPSTPTPKTPSTTSSGGIGQALFQGTAADLTWHSTLPWLAAHTSLPIILKGIQTHDDALLAAQHHPHVRAIILSNHGGRAADTAPPAIHTLLEIRAHAPSVFERLEVYVDGGVRRGTDVVKALCLGARAVGVGRAPLWGLAAGGPEGVERVLRLLAAETETAMRLLGVTRVGELRPCHVNARKVEREIYMGVDGEEEEGKGKGLWRPQGRRRGARAKL